jgi:hypothetical protein
MDAGLFLGAQNPRLIQPQLLGELLDIGNTAYQA